MKISGPERYELSSIADGYAVKCSRGTPRFSGIAATKKPKLYIASLNQKPIYVGQTTRLMRERIYGGWYAKGKNGYYGYAWRREIPAVILDVWSHEDAPLGKGRGLEMETVEAEVVFLIRGRTGQWPQYQTEIHFHHSSEEHRRVAAMMLEHYRM